MRVAAFLIIGLTLLVIQTSLFQGFPSWIGVPDLLFILVVFSAICLTLGQGVILVFAFGTAVEVFSGYFLGMYLLAYGITFTLIRSAASTMAIKEPAQQPAITAMTYLISSGLVYIFSTMLAEESLSPWSWGETLQRVLIITILTIPMNRIFQLIMEQCDKKYERRSFFVNRKYVKGNRYRPRKRQDNN